MRTLHPGFLILGGILAVSACCAVGGIALAQESWEFLGPGVGYRPDALFVSKNAVYVGLSEEDGAGLGLYRYRFDTEQWDLFAWPGYSIFGITVWGASDENILLIRYRSDERGSVLRSTDGGSTWVTTYENYYGPDRLTQAPSDTLHILINDAPRYSTDAGWTWNPPHGGPANYPSHAIFDPVDPHVAYCIGGTMIETIAIYKSTDAGANWRTSCDVCWVWEMDVERGNSNHVMASSYAQSVVVSTNAGQSWFTRGAPFETTAIRSMPWWPGCFFASGTSPDWTTYEVWRTTDLGESWSPCGDGLPATPSGPSYSKMFLEGHPSEPAVFVALEDSGIWRWNLSGAAAPDGEPTREGAVQLLLYPNPSSRPGSCMVRLRSPERVALRLFDARGRLVNTLQEGLLSAGAHTFRWEPGPPGDGMASSGIYYLRLDAGSVHEERKLVLLK